MQQKIQADVRGEIDKTQREYFLREQLKAIHRELGEGDVRTADIHRLRERVERARERQRQRFAGTNLQVNADMGPAEVRQYCEVDSAGKNLLRAAMRKEQ
jgi:ATP-dependent Lon protease